MINLNGRLHAELPDSFTLLQRAVYYGDGLFETIRSFDGQLLFWESHWERLSKGMEVLGLEAPPHWTNAYFEQAIQQISPPNARIRLTVWRSPGGLYFPSDNTPQFLITAEPLESGGFQWLETGLEVCLSEQVRLPVDALSGIKTLNGARYVAAAREAREKGAADAIVLNAYGRVAEATGSNVLWIKGDTVFFPPLLEGQVQGTFQQMLCKLLQKAGWQLQEKPALVSDLFEADELFLTNAISGIRWVRKFENQVFGCEKVFQFHGLMVEHVKRLTNRN